jgi:hypothetical protein
MHGPLGQQLEYGGADVAALATSASAATSAARAVAEAATGVEAELEAASARAKAAARSESRAEGPVVTRIVLAQMIAEVAARLAALVMERAAVAGTEAEAESAGRWCEWVAHMEWFLTFVRKRLVRFRYVNDISEPIVMQRLFWRPCRSSQASTETGSAAQ